MKVLFQYKGKVIRVDAKCLTVVYPTRDNIAVRTFCDAHTSPEEDAANILRVVHAASEFLLGGIDPEKSPVDGG